MRPRGSLEPSLSSSFECHLKRAVRVLGGNRLPYRQAIGRSPTMSDATSTSFQPDVTPADFDDRVIGEDECQVAVVCPVLSQRSRCGQADITAHEIALQDMRDNVEDRLETRIRIPHAIDLLLGRNLALPWCMYADSKRDGVVVGLGNSLDAHGRRRQRRSR